MFCYRALFALLLGSVSLSYAQDVINAPQGEQIPGPYCSDATHWRSGTPVLCRPAEVAAWLKDIQHWRTEQSIRFDLDQDQHGPPDLSWTQNSFIQPQMMVHDRYFYSAAEGRYTVARYLDDLTARYGGIDSVLVWHTYPNIGVDDRNQYDLFRDLPGGTDGVREMVDDFHRHGVRVFFPLMLWDQGTRDEGVPDATAISTELAAVGADGINGDTLEGFPRNFRLVSDQLKHPLALETENAFASDEMLGYNDMSWGYWKYNFVPSISRYKWLEHRHMVNLCNRWAHDHQNDLQHAFFNGIGFESWENVWGVWNGLTPRDSETLRRIGALYRAFSDFLISPEWVPHVPMPDYGVFASKWPNKHKTLWTIVNRNHYRIAHERLRTPTRSGVHYYDLWHGIELKPQQQGDTTTIDFDLEADGYGSILETDSPDAKLVAVLASMRRMSALPLSSFSNEWTTLPQKLVTTAASILGQANDKEGMVEIPGGDFLFRVSGIEIEGGNDEGVDVQYPWEGSARRYHRHPMHLAPFLIDRYPVTNRQYKQFADVSGYRPRDAHNYLRDWKNGSYPLNWDNKPVTWVSLEDARAYAVWAGKRLPHEWEWQYAAQGVDERTYPWGETYPGTFAGNSPVPEPDKGRSMQPASDVAAHPAGASPFGVMDMTGNVWQWTDEYVDDHTRAAIIRGGSHYQPQGAQWYFPQAYKLNEHGKYLLMAPGMDRSGAIGFRCVRDLK